MPLLPEDILLRFFKRPEDRFINRELSWLSFNERVMEEAYNITHPLLERVRFLSISANNLDEFYMVRVAGLKDLVNEQIATVSIDGLSPSEQLEKIYLRTSSLIRQQQECWIMLKEALVRQGIVIIAGKDVSEEERAWLKNYFLHNIFPALTPLAIDPAHPFPLLPNLGLALVLELKHRSRKKHLKAIVPLPQKLNRLVMLPSEDRTLRVIALEDILLLFESYLFADSDVLTSGIIRVIRDSDLEISDEAEDLVRHFEWAVQQRRRGNVIRLKVNKGLPDSLKEFVTEQLKLGSEDVVEVNDMLGLASIGELLAIDRPDLKFPAYEVRFPERIADYGGDYFSAIYAKDIIIHHPYESFDVVVQFLRQAASDPDVVAIKQTLYRTSNDSEVIQALVEAAEAGKSVTVVVELKARFDEEVNIKWARNLERAGAQVVYGLVGLKTHAKVSMVVRRVDGQLRSYVHIGTGNYHPITAKVYSDLSFFSCDPDLCRDVAYLFNYLTGYSPPEKFEKIAMAPLTLRKSLVALIEEEIQHAREERPAQMWIKMNSLVDDKMIDMLYYASQQGVSIHMIVRGICALRPGIKGFSENIQVKSIVGRFLEHARIFCFGGGHVLPSPKAKVFIASADWMHRNFDRRVEVMVPVENPTVHVQVLNQIMQANMQDKKQSWILNAEGIYTRAPFQEEDFSAHAFFMTNPSLSGRGTAIHRDKETGHGKKRK